MGGEYRLKVVDLSYIYPFLPETQWKHSLSYFFEHSVLSESSNLSILADKALSPEGYLAAPQRYSESDVSMNLLPVGSSGDTTTCHAVVKAPVINKINE